MQDSEDNLDGREFHHNGARAWIAVILALLVATSGYSLFRLSRQDQQRAELLKTNQALQSSLDLAKSDLKAATDKLSEANAQSQLGQVSAQIAQPEPDQLSAPENPPAVKPVHKIKKAAGSHPPASAPAAKDPRWEEMDAKLANQQQQIESTKSDVAKTREDLEGRLGTTRDELNGAIAKTHDEVQDLRRRGERNIYEFNLNKSSEFARTGPVSLSLRKANVKHKYFDIALIVEDQKIEKKHVNLYEPLWVGVPGHPEPVQVVVNSITKDNVKGYLSESKYKKSELASSAGAGSTMSVPSSQNPGASQPGSGSSDKGLNKSLQ